MVNEAVTSAADSRVPRSRSGALSGCLGLHVALSGWDLMFGHLMAYKESMKETSGVGAKPGVSVWVWAYGSVPFVAHLKEPVSLHVPVSATVHGEPVGVRCWPLVWFHVLAICGASRRQMGGSAVSGVAPAS